ncbi:MAG: DNA polymerase III subunit delta, partial [Paramuribaculum sp.]|nr:DNA polymerase III subunit delta [Paramuribaculum sp.]
IDTDRQRVFQDIDAWTDSFGKKGSALITYAAESGDLIHKLSMTSHTSAYKTVVWWLPERMNQECANKLLKMIEEPYEGTCLIMASDRPDLILPTVYSRLQRVEVSRYDDSAIAAYLVARMGIDDAAAQAAAHNARGSMRRAMTMVSANTWTRTMLPRFMELMRLAYQRNVGELRRWANDLAGDGRDRAAAFCDFAAAQVRENFMARLAGLTSPLVYMTPDESAFAKKFCRFITEANAEPLIREFGDARRDIIGNANVKIVAFDLALKVILLLLPPKK